MTSSPVPTVRLTTAQATVRFLVNPYSTALSTAASTLSTGG